MGIFATGINKGAYQGKLTCPYTYYKDGEIKVCGSTANRFLEYITPTRMRYRCRKCGGAYQYEISGLSGCNPYAPYRKGMIWRRIMRVTGGRKLKGGMT